MTEESTAMQRKRLHMRSIRRGTKEMDLILGSYAESRLPSMDGVALGVYEALLCENDQELYAWVTRQASAPERYSGLIEDIAVHVGT